MSGRANPVNPRSRQNVRRVDAADERFVRAFLKYGLFIMLAVSLGLAYLLGVI